MTHEKSQTSRDGDVVEESAVDPRTVVPQTRSLDEETRTPPGWKTDGPTTVVLAGLTVAVVCLGLALGLVLGLHNCDDEANDQPFQVTLTILTDAPLIETSNTSSVGLGAGGSATTWYFPYYMNDPRVAPWLLEFNGGGGWFDSAVRIEGIRDWDDTVDVQVYFHNVLRMESRIHSVFADDEVSAPACSPAFRMVDVRGIALGNTSERFALGSCTVTRLDDSQLEPRRITLDFSGTVSVDRGWEGSPRFDHYPW